MAIPASCKDIINRNRINECCEPDLEGKPLKQQAHYLTGCCSYLTSVIIALIQLVGKLEQETSQAPSGGSGA